MKCPYCGYDKIQPKFNICPRCKKVINQEGLKDVQKKITSSFDYSSRNPQEKGFINRALSRWTFESANADPYSYAAWAYRNPNDNRHFLERWRTEGHDISIIRNAIAEANRARRENPTVDETDVRSQIIDSNQQTSRQTANNTFVEAVNSDQTTDAAAIVRNKAIWKLQPGELARHIAPDEWCYVSEHLEGLVIEEGTSAIIYVDGIEVANMGSGMYVFDDKHAAAAELEAERRKHETQGFLSRMADGIYRFFTGHKRSENSSQREERRRRIQQIMGRLKKDTIIDVYLKSDRVFPAIFGKQHLSDTPDGYAPYIIQSLNLDIEVGVSMQMQIGDFKTFITNYMAGKKTISILDIVKSADASVYSILKYQLRNVEISERGLDEQSFISIKNHLRANLPNVLYGIIVVDVLDITTDNKQLQRFRQVEEQLYCSEREYDFLLRTNEFKNRLASEENDQKIREAKSDSELQQRLDEVNKDNLIHADEMDQFVALLKNQKTIREAQNQVDLDKAMSEIQRNRLVTKEEFDAFNEDLNNQRFNRNQVSEQLRAKSLMATALAKLDIDKTLQIANIQNAEAISEAEFEALKKAKGHEAEGWDLEAAIYGRQYVYEHQKLLNENADALIRAQHENEVASVKRAEQRAAAEYDDERAIKEHERDVKIKKDEHELDIQSQRDNIEIEKEKIDISLSQTERMSELAMKNMQAMKEAELAAIKAQHEHEEAMADKEADVEKTRIAAEKEMDSDQLMAKNIANMDAAAQTAFAESFSHLNEIELNKKSAEEKEMLYKEMVEMAKVNGLNVQQLQNANAAQQQETMRQMMATFAQMMKDSSFGQQTTMTAMLGAMQNVANEKIKDATAMKEEYRDQAIHQQERTDANQEQALNFTSRVKVSENIPPVMGTTSVSVRVGQRTCPICGESIMDSDSLCCPTCGADLK